MTLLIRKIHLPHKGHECLFNADWIHEYEDQFLTKLPLFT